MDTVFGDDVVKLDWRTAAAASRAVLAGMSPRSRYLRFHAGMPSILRRLQGQEGGVDGIVHAALGLRVGAEWVGIARCVRTAPGQAEISVAVVDRWQGLGAGRALLTAMRDHATALGYHQLSADVLDENAAALALLSSVFCVDARTASAGVVSLELSAGTRVDCPGGAVPLAS